MIGSVLKCLQQLRCFEERKSLQSVALQQNAINLDIWWSPSGNIKAFVHEMPWETKYKKGFAGCVSFGEVQFTIAVGFSWGA